MPSNSRRSRSRSPAFGRISLDSSNDGSEDDSSDDLSRDSDSDVSNVSSDAATSSASTTSSADTIQRAKRGVILVSIFWVLHATVLNFVLN